MRNLKDPSWYQMEIVGQCTESKLIASCSEDRMAAECSRTVVGVGSLAQECAHMGCMPWM